MSSKNKLLVALIMFVTMIATLFVSDIYYNYKEKQMINKINTTIRELIVEMDKRG